LIRVVTKVALNSATHINLECIVQYFSERFFATVLVDAASLDFHAEFTDTTTAAPTQERRGTTFLKLLCIAFDLAVLIS